MKESSWNEAGKSDQGGAKSGGLGIGLTPADKQNVLPQGLRIPIFRPATTQGLSPGAIDTVDASRTQFRVGNAARVRDLLYALPWVRGTPVFGSIVSSTSIEMIVQVQRATSVPVMTYFTLASTDLTDTTVALDTVQQFKLGRLGARGRVLAIDAAATPNGVAQDFAAFNLQVAASSVIHTLNKTIAIGTGSGSDFKGLGQLSADNARTVASSGNAETDARTALAEIYASGTGAGEGPDCLIGGPLLMKKLMSTTSGQNGASGWRRDARTGRTTYHYMGIPYYRAQTTETTTGPLYAANLGATGLNLIYVYGTPESFGIVAQEMPVTAMSAARDVTVQGAWTLVAWEKEALYEITAVPVT